MRCFWAVPVPDDVKARLAHTAAEIAGLLEPAGHRFRPATGGGMHVTLAFLGDVPDVLVSRMISEVGANAAPRSGGCQELRVARLGCFPYRGPVRVVWAGVADPQGLLALARGSICLRLASLGLSVDDDGPFVPHITLGRLRDAASGTRAILNSALESHVGVDFGAVELREATLYSSELRPSGTHYEALCSVAWSGLTP